MKTGVRIRNAAGTMLAGSVQKAYDFLELDNNELEINMYGEVVESVPLDWWTGKPTEGLYICEKDFVKCWIPLSLEEWISYLKGMRSRRFFILESEISQKRQGIRR